jgi:hypothetical protein
MSRAGCFVQSNLEDNFPESATGGEAMKSLASRSRKLIMKDQNNSIFARVAGDFAFQQAILVVVVLNAIWICLDVELNHDALKKDGKKPLEPYSTVIENCFCVLFFTELVIRFLAYQHKRTCLKDVWFMFDGALVFFMILEVWMLPLYQDVFSSGGDSDGLSNFSSFRLLRLLRLTRMARIMRFVPELMVLVKSTVQAMQSVGFILLFLLLCTFVFALVFTSLLGTGTDDCGGLDARRLSRLLSGDYVEEVEDEDPNAHQLFCTLFSSMMTLFTNGVLQDNLAQTLAPVKEDNLALFWCFVVFECIASITLLNMLIGVLCQVITQTYEREGNIRRNKWLQEALEQAFKAADKSMDGMISEEEWKEMSADGVVRSTCFALFPSLDESQLDMQLQKLEMTLFKQDKQMRHGGTKDVLSTSSMKSAASLIKKEPKTVEFERFVEQVIELRWDTAASILDVENLASHVLAEDKRLRDKMSGIEGQVAKALEARGLASLGSALGQHRGYKVFPQNCSFTPSKPAHP